MENQTTTEAVINSEKLIEVTPIEETPFAVLKHEDKFYLVMGNYRLTSACKTFEEAKEQAEDASWNRILQVIVIALENSKNIVDLEQKVKELENKINLK